VARKEIIELIDDRDGRPADQTIEFTWGGVDRTIDLTNKNAAKFEADIKPWLDASTVVRRVRPRRSHRRVTKWPEGIGPTKNGNGDSKKNGNGKHGKTKSDTKIDGAAVRAWAIENGHPVGHRGRISADTYAAYKAWVKANKHVTVQ
jgi:hypothetical protein